MIYNVRLNKEAADDLYNLTFVIHEIYHAPLTAQKYTKGLLDTINSLQVVADVFAICT